MAEEIKVETTQAVETSAAPVEVPVAPVATDAAATTTKKSKSKKPAKPKVEKKSVKEGTRDGRKTYPTYVKGKSCGPGKHEYRKVADKKYARCSKCNSTKTVTEKKA